MKRLKERKNGNFFHLFCILEIIFATDTFISFANTNETIKHVFQFMIICSIAVLMFESFQQKKDFSKYLLFGGGMIVIVCLSMLINRDVSNGNLIKIILLMFGLFFAYNVGFDYMKSKYVAVMKVVALFSIVTFLLTPVIQKFCTFLPLLSNGNQSVYFLILSNVPVKSSVFRNWGPFWEPGVFQIYLTLALIFNLYSEKCDKVSNIAFVVAILTTVSTAGYIILAIVGGGYLLRKRKLFPDREKREHIKRTFIIYFILLIILCVAFAVLVAKTNLLEILFDKLNPNSASFSSTNSRLMSITANLNILWNHFFFGCGSENILQLYNDYTLKMCGMLLSNTNGFLLNFATFGIGFGLLYSALLYKMTIRITQDRISRLILLSSLILMMCCEPLINSLMFNSLIFFGIDKIQKKEYNNLHIYSYLIEA